MWARACALTARQARCNLTRPMGWPPKIPPPPVRGLCVLMARHPPFCNRVQQLSRVPVALWRRLVKRRGVCHRPADCVRRGATLATALASCWRCGCGRARPILCAGVLAIAQPWVPALETLEMEDDTDASVRNGGELGTVRWADGQGLRITASGVTLSWDWLPLLKAEPLAVVLKAGEVHIDERPPATDAPAPPKMCCCRVASGAAGRLPGSCRAQPVVIREHTRHLRIRRRR